MGGKADTTCLKVAVSDAVLEVRAAQPLQSGVPHGDLPGFPELRRRLAGLHRRSQTTHKHVRTHMPVISVTPNLHARSAFNFERALPYHDEDGRGVGLELGVLLQRHVRVAQEREHLLGRGRDLEDPAPY
jgi:hypothetical protein